MLPLGPFLDSIIFKLTVALLLNAVPKSQSQMALQVPSTSIELHRDATSFTLKGRSRAGDGTTFVLQQLKWMFDMGAMVQPAMPDIVCLTHTHHDHITFMAQILTETTRHTQVYLPAKALPHVQKYLQAHQELTQLGEEENEEGGKDDATKHYTLHPLEFGDTFEVKIKETIYSVTALECHHRIDCLGFSIFHKVKALKPEYGGLDGPKIGALQRQGISCYQLEESPLLCYLGDTTHAVFDNHPEILRQHRFIVVECSFLCDNSRRNAEATKHMHWRDLKPIVESNPRVLFILIHFSLRYSALDIRRFFINATTTHNVHPMLVESEVEAILAASKRGDSGKGGVPCCDCFWCEEQRRKDQPAEATEEDDADADADDGHHSKPSGKHGKGRPDRQSDKRSRNKTRGGRKGQRDYY